MVSKRPHIEHFVIEIFNINEIKKVEDIYEKIKLFIKKCNLNVVEELNHNFSPEGFTIVFILSESHIIFHSWPENNYLNIDLMSCKPIKNKKEIISLAKNIFCTNKVNLRKIKYGNK